MSISAFGKLFNAIVPSFKKHQLLYSIEQSKDKLVNSTLPVYVTAKEIFDGGKFKSKECKELQEIFNTHLRKHSSTNFVVTVSECLENSVSLLDVLEKHATQMFANNEVSVLSDLRKQTLVKLANVIEFSVNYSRALLNYIYVYECNTESKTSDYRLTKGYISEIENNFSNFCKAIGILTHKSIELEKNLMSIPSVELDEANEEIVVATIGSDKADPFNLVGFTAWNPFYIIGMSLANWQADSYKSSLEEKQLLELRALSLRNRRDGNSDANIDRELEVLQNRIDKLNKTIKDKQDSYEL